MVSLTTADWHTPSDAWRLQELLVLRKDTGQKGGCGGQRDNLRGEIDFPQRQFGIFSATMHGCKQRLQEEIITHAAVANKTNSSTDAVWTVEPVTSWAAELKLSILMTMSTESRELVDACIA